MTDPTSPHPGASSTPLEDRLAAARRAWAARDARRTIDCPHPSGALYRRIVADGSTQVYTGCTECQADLGRGRVIAHSRVDPHTLPVGDDRRYLNPPCQVCGAFGTQLHHWAPREVFGQIEADHWPTSYLCVRCHTEWHKRVTDHYGDAGRPF